MGMLPAKSEAATVATIIFLNFNMGLLTFLRGHTSGIVMTSDAALPVRYQLVKQDQITKARLGVMTTPNGSFNTPAFMPVGTQGTIKGVLPDHVASTGSQCILANTYHLMLRPGSTVVRDLGDLHRFMAWPGPS